MGSYTVQDPSQSPPGETLQLTNTENGPLEEFRTFLLEHGLEYNIYSFQETKREEEHYTFHRLKIYNRELIFMLRDRYKWRGRKEDPRYYPPPGSLSPAEEEEFLRYYLRSKSTLDQGPYGPRLRIYGNWNLLDSINLRLYELLGGGIKKPQKHSGSEKMKVLYYQSAKEIRLLLGFMEQGK